MTFLMGVLLMKVVVVQCFEHLEPVAQKCGHDGALLLAESSLDWSVVVHRFDKRALTGSMLQVVLVDEYLHNLVGHSNALVHDLDLCVLHVVVVVGELNGVTVKRQFLLLLIDHQKLVLYSR
jgi:hypothetical protein